MVCVFFFTIIKFILILQRCPSYLSLPQIQHSTWWAAVLSELSLNRSRSILDVLLLIGTGYNSVQNVGLRTIMQQNLILWTLVFIGHINSELFKILSLPVYKLLSSFNKTDTLSFTSSWWRHLNKELNLNSFIHILIFYDSLNEKLQAKFFNATCVCLPIEPVGDSK